VLWIGICGIGICGHILTSVFFFLRAFSFFLFFLEEITAKDHALVKEHFDHAKVEKEKEGLRNELSKMKKLLEDNSETIDSQNQELIKLTSMIQKMDAMAIQQRNEYEQVINERDILGKARYFFSVRCSLVCIFLFVVAFFVSRICGESCLTKFFFPLSSFLFHLSSSFFFHLSSFFFLLFVFTLQALN